MGVAEGARCLADTAGAGVGRSVAVAAGEGGTVDEATEAGGVETGDAEAIGEAGDGVTVGDGCAWGAKTTVGVRGAATWRTLSLTSSL